MTENFVDNKNRAADDLLRAVLRAHDPLRPPGDLFVSALETKILTQVNGLKAQKRKSFWARPLWVPFPNWSAQAAAFGAIMVLVSGFFVGQVGYADDATAVTGLPSLLSYVDEPILHYIPVTDQSLGDTNDDAE